MEAYIESAPLPPSARAQVEEAAQVIEAIRLFARPEILKHYRVDSCIASTRVIFDLLKRYELKPRAVACHARVLNPQLVKRINETGRYPQTNEEIVRWSEEDGSWNVGIGGTGERREGRWDGHLVALAFGRVLIDASIDQANRPKHNIELPPIAATVPDGWLEGDQLVVEERGCLVLYKAQPGERRWLQTAGWKMHREIRREIVNKVAVKVESWLKDA